MKYLQERDMNIPFAGSALKVCTLVSILGINPMRVNRPSDIVLLDNDTIEINKGLGDHVHPLVRQPLRVLLVSVPEETRPGEDLLRRPAVGIIPLPVRAC